MSVCFVTRATCKNVRQNLNLGPLPKGRVAETTETEFWLFSSYAMIVQSQP